MANIKSSEKRYRQSLKRRARNVHVRSGVKTAMLKVRDAITGKDPAKAKDALRAAEKELRKAASKGVFHARNVDRRVSRLAKAVAALAPK